MGAVHVCRPVEKQVDGRARELTRMHPRPLHTHAQRMHGQSATYRFLISTAPLKAFLGTPWIWFSLRSLDREERRQRNYLARSRAKLSQSHLLCSTST